MMIDGRICPFLEQHFARLYNIFEWKEKKGSLLLKSYHATFTTDIWNIC